MNTRKRFRAQLAVLEAKQAARMAQRREGEKKQKAQERIEELRRKPEEELTPEERDLTRA